MIFQEKSSLVLCTLRYAGELLVVPSGVMETDTEAKITHCTYVFTRIDLNR